MAQQYVEAVREFEAYARLAPREPEPHLGLARTYAMMGLPERAVEATGRALEIDPASAPAREIHAWTLGMLGRFDAALAVDPGVFLQIMFLSRSGRVREADRRAAEEVRPAGAGGNRRMVTAVHVIHCSETAGRGDYDHAVTICGQIDDSAAPLPAEPRRLSQVMANALGGVSHARRGRLDRASAHLASLTRIHRPAVPLEHWLHKALEGEIALARGELQKAERAFTEGEPPVRTFGFGTGMANNPPFTDGLARIAAAKGDLPGAISRYRNLLTQSAEHKWQALLQPLYVLQLARLLERTGNREAARQEYERFLEIWQHADADRPEVGEARAAVARLR
jgi:tetratricopeptide (TPR) repeat protein